jgi:hypothetical protein
VEGVQIGQEGSHRPLRACLLAAVAVEAARPALESIERVVVVQAVGPALEWVERAETMSCRP